jgi:LacI family transcriptional regulator
MAMPSRGNKRRSHLPEVALLVETASAFGRQLLRGISTYIRENGPWLVQIEQRSIYDPPPYWLKNWHGDGIISRVDWAEVFEIGRKHGIPVVDLNECVIDLNLPGLINDHLEIGRLGAEHLMERGFTHFGFIGSRGLPWSDGRRDGFARSLAARNQSFAEYQSRSKGSRDFRHHKWEIETHQVGDWVAKLPKPAGIMAANDFHAMQLLDACRLVGVAVPEQAAVIGVDNEDSLCELTVPPLSTVVPGAFQMGREAAALLDALMQGKSPPKRKILVPPQGVITRASTDVMAITDPVVARAIKFIRLHACDGIRIDDVLREVLVSRTVLQNRFRESLGRSLHDAIQDVRLQRAKELLIETALPLADVAERAGFKHLQYFMAVFKDLTETTPAQFRRKHGRKLPRPFQTREI